MGGQLGSSCLEIVQQHRKNTLPAFSLCQLAPHGCEDSAAIEISAFRRISGGADMYVPFSGIKKVLRQKTLNFFGKKLPNKKGSRQENRKNKRST